MCCIFCVNEREVYKVRFISCVSICYIPCFTRGRITLFSLHMGAKLKNVILYFLNRALT
jgi:hypothetical protein